MRSTCGKLVLLFLLLSVLNTCGCSTSDTPSRVMEKYISAVQKQDYATAWNLLSRKTRHDLEEQSGKQGPPVLKEKITALLKAGDNKTQLMTSKATGEKAEDGKATVTIQFQAGEKSAALNSQEITLFKEKQAWKIRL